MKTMADKIQAINQPIQPIPAKDDTLISQQLMDIQTKLNDLKVKTVQGNASPNLNGRTYTVVFFQ